MTVDSRDDQLGSIFQSQQCLISVQAEVVLECGIYLGEHLYVGASTEKLVARPGKDDDVNIVVHACLKNGVIQLPVHGIAVGVRRRIVQLDHCHSRLDPIFNQRGGINRTCNSVTHGHPC